MSGIGNLFGKTSDPTQDDDVRVLRPMPFYEKPADRISPGSSRLEPVEVTKERERSNLPDVYDDVGDIRVFDRIKPRQKR